MHEYVYVNMHCRSSVKTARGKCNREETDSSRRGGVEVCVGRAERSSRSYRGALSVSDHCTMFCIFWARCVIPCICSASPHLTCLVLEIVGCFWNTACKVNGVLQCFPDDPYEVTIPWTQVRASFSVAFDWFGWACLGVIAAYVVCLKAQQYREDHQGQPACCKDYCMHC